MIYRHHRAKVGTVECTVDLCCLVTAVTSVRSIPVSVVVDGLQPHLQPIGDVRSQVQVDIETAVLIVVMFQCSPLVEETYRTVIGGLARTSVERQGVLLHQGVIFDGFIYPVGVAAIQILVGIGRIDEYRQIVFRVGIIGIDMIHIVLIVVIASTRVAVGQIMEIGKCPRIHILRFACRRIDRPVGRERDLGFLVFTFLGGNQHDTIGCLCSVNRSRSRILQYRYAFHIGRIDHVGIHLHTIDQYQGSGRVYRCSTTNVEPVSFARRTVVGGNVQVTDHTLQSLAKIGDRATLQCLCRNTGYGSGEVGFLLCTITHHHDFVQGFAVLFQGDLQTGLCGNGHDLCFHSNKGDLKLLSLFRFNREVTIHIGDCSTSGSTLYQYRSPGKRRTRDVKNTTGYFLFLLFYLHHSGRCCIVAVRSKARLKSHTRKKDKHP